ncbi:MAG TPA: MEDS domain-containing protein [Terriglobales bacterium]|nr:MEDS domain-containing protein [Terriglobales bacterium]
MRVRPAHPKNAPMIPHISRQVCSHAVQFYDDDAFLVATVARHIIPALSADGAAVVIATKSHRDAVDDELALRGLDLRSRKLQGRYLSLDAEETLREFMVEGWPDEALFKATVGGLVSRALAIAGSMRLPCFGEMVALLWARGQRDAALRLEQLWNILGERHSFSLLCAYPLADFQQEKDRRHFFNICGEHTEVNPAEGYPAQGNERQRRRAVAGLQRENRALRNEIRLSQQRILLLQGASQAGTWEMDVLDETFSFSSKTARMLGLPCGDVSLVSFLAVMRYSGDRDNFLECLKRARTGRKEFVAEFRIDRNGETRLLSIRGKTYYNHGQPVILGILSDVTPPYAQAA